MNETTSPNKKKAAIAAGLAATIAVVGLGAPAISQAMAEDAPAPTRVRPAQVEAAPALGDTTLDELAEALDELGLVVEISPNVQGETQPTLQPPTTSTPTPEVVADDDPVETDDDPFAGMTEAEIDALSDEEFFAILDEAGVDFDDEAGEDSSATDEDSSAEGGEEAPLGTFTVQGDNIDTSSATPHVAAQAQAIWDRFAALVPADQRQMVVSFELMSEGYGGAHVYATDDDPTKWVLGVGLGMGNELDYTLVHEFGHLLTLQAKEVPPGDNPDGCTTYYTGEGCALSGSTFAGFVQQFWPQRMIDEINRIQESGDWDAADAFYQENKDKFVTDYATTNPAEDVAETFATFVMNDRPNGETIADQKVQFLWNDPDMVALRTQIRAAL